MRKWAILIVIGVVSSVVGCSSKSLPPTPTPIILNWNTSPTARIIRIAESNGQSPVVFDHNFYIPEVQIWGDGHVLWIPTESRSGWDILEGQLTPEQMKAVLQ